MAAPPDSSSSLRAWIDRLGWTVPLMCGALVGLGIRLLCWGKPGQAYDPMLRSFVLLVPILVGAVAVYVAERVERRSWSDYLDRRSCKFAFCLWCVPDHDRRHYLRHSRGSSFRSHRGPRGIGHGSRVPLDALAETDDLWCRRLTTPAGRL